MDSSACDIVLSEATQSVQWNLREGYGFLQRDTDLTQGLGSYKRILLLPPNLIRLFASKQKIK